MAKTEKRAMVQAAVRICNQFHDWSEHVQLQKFNELCDGQHKASTWQQRLDAFGLATGIVLEAI